MHEIHMEHHLERFPPSDFYGSAELYAEMYPCGKPTIWSLLDLTKTTNIGDGTAAAQDVTKDKEHTPLAHEGPLMVIMAMILVGGYFLVGTPGPALGFATFLYFTMSSVGNALHMSFHVRGFHLEKYPWYLELRALHYIHHLGDMKSNLAMFNLGLDGTFGSLALEDPMHKHKGIHGGKKQYGEKGIYSNLIEDMSDLETKAMQEGGLTHAHLMGAAQHAGAIAYTLGLDMPVCIHESGSGRSSKRGYPTVLCRLVISGLGLYAWYQTQQRVSEWLQSGGDQSWDMPDPATHYDPGFVLFAPLRVWLERHELVTAACALSAALSDATGALMLLASLGGTTFRPALSTLIAFAMRWCLHALGALQVVPLVATNIWELPPEWPTVFVQHGPAAHAFFSFRIAVTNIAAMELLSITVYSPRSSQFARRGAAMLAATFLTYNISLTLALQVRGHSDSIYPLLIY